MGDPRDEMVECERHGPQPATFVCRHLIDGLRTGAAVGFHVADDPGNPRPDAWRSECEARVLSTGGEWTDESEAFAGVTLLCGECYDLARTRSGADDPT